MYLLSSTRSPDSCFNLWKVLIRLDSLSAREFEMIFPIVAIAATLSLSIANPVTVSSSRQIPVPCIDPSVTLPARCLEALVRITNVTKNLNSTRPENLSRLSGALQSAIGVLCSSDCLDSYIRCISRNSDFEMVRNFTTQIFCVRAQDGYYCPVKMLLVQARVWGGHIPPDCDVDNATTCSSSCQQFFRQIRDDLGCCAATVVTHPALVPVQSFERNLAACGVSLGNPCSGAAIIYLNLVLVLAMVLVSLAIL